MQYEATVPTVADRVAQTVAYLYLEPEVEPVFHQDSYGYRPRRSAHDALRVCRARCWKDDWGKRRDKTVMKERMRTPYIEGLATHDDPELWKAPDNRHGERNERVLR